MKSPQLKAAYRVLHSGAMSSMCALSPRFLTSLRYRLAWGRLPDLESPTTFDEKLQWLNLYWPNPLKARCGDKFTLRGFVEEHHLGHLLPQLFGVYSSTRDIVVDHLPARFVMKCTHGCKCNVFCHDKQMLDWKTAQRSLDAWMKEDFSKRLGELHYGDMVPRIICEEFLQDDSGYEFPTDYKVFCCAGRVCCTMTGTRREPNGIARLAFYDLEWKLLPYCISELAAATDIPKPAGYDEMIECARTLSARFPFVRIDFYSINGRARLGEMTFTPGACVSADYMTERAQQELGCQIVLPAPYID